MRNIKDNIYVYLWEEFNTIYIGRTVNPKGRHYAHKHRESEKTYQFSDEHHVEHPKMIIIENDLTIENGIKREKYWIEYYKYHTHYNVLNKTCGGEIGELSNLTEEEKKKRLKEYYRDNRKKINAYYREYYKKRTLEKKISKLQEKITKKIEKCEKKIGKLVYMESKMKEYQKEYYRKNRNRIRDKQKEWRDKNEERIKMKYIERKEYFRKYYKDNKEKIRECQKKYREEHKVDK